MADMAGDDELAGAEDPLAQCFDDENIVHSYVSACEKANETVDVGVKRSLIECCIERRSGIWIEARGNEAEVFSTRISDMHLPILTSVLEPAIKFLTRVDLSYNKITDTGCATIAMGLIKDGVSLKSLLLRGNDISSAGVESMLLNQQVHSLARLDISHNPLGKLGGLALAAFLQTNRTLVELFAADTELDIDALIAISAVLHVNNDTLRILDVENPRLFSLQGEHCTHFGKMLRVNPALSECYFGKFRFRDSNIEMFLDDIGVDQGRLRVLDLRCNEIGASGAECLAEMVKYGQLHTLNLNNNRIGERDNVSGARALGDAIRESRTLCNLFVNHNQICDKGIQYILEPVASRAVQRELSLAIFWNNFERGANRMLHQIYHTSKIFAFRCDALTQAVDDLIYVAEVDQFYINEGRVKKW